jgi:signal transduction histidine kinase
MKKRPPDIAKTESAEPVRREKRTARPTLFSNFGRRDLRTLLHPQKALDRIVAAAVRSTRADSGSFILLNPNSGLLDIEASLGLSERAKKVKLRPGEGITGWVATTGMPLRTGDVREEKRYIAINPRVRSEMAVPVEIRGQVVGLLNVDSTNIEAFSATDEERLVDMASEAARWLELAWEVDQLRLRGRQLTSLVDTAQMIISEMNLDEILNQITVQTFRLMKTRLCSVFLLNEDGTELVLRACHGGTELYRGKPNLRTEDSLLGSVVTRHKPVSVVDVMREKGYIHTDVARKERLVSMLAVPLIFAKKAIGVLAVYTQQRHRFSNDEVKLLTTLGDLSAVAIEKGRLLARVVDMEEKLRASERLSALGLLAAEIAHEIRNPLTVMQMLFHALVETLHLDTTSQRDAELIGEKMRQMNRILDQVLSFARSSEPIKDAVHAQQLFDDIFLLTRHKLQQQGIDVRSTVPEDLPPFRADREQIEQVLLNLILNAADAMPDGGMLRLSAAVEEFEGLPHLALSVRDNGQGMTADQIANLFAPFLTYKDSGTGIGLAIVKKIMENHQSQVQVESKVGQGTKFKLLFPIADPHAPVSLGSEL